MNRIVGVSLELNSQHYLSLWIHRETGQMSNYMAHNNLRAERMMNLFLAIMAVLDKSFLKD